MAKAKVKNYFPFKDGYCHILKDKILLTQTEKPDENQLVQKKTVPYSQIATYLFFAILFSLYFLDQYQFGSRILAVVFLIFASLFSIGSVNLMTMKLVPKIERSNITRVRYVKKFPLLARASIQIEFKEQGKRKQVTWLYLEDEQVSQALQVLQHHGLLK